MQNANRVRGIGVLISNLLAAMGKLDAGNEFSLVTLKGNELPSFFQREDRLPTWRLDRPNRFNWIVDHLFLPGVVRKSGADLFLATDFNSYIVSQPKVKVVSFVYDLIPLIFPEVMAQQPLSIKIGWPLNFGKLKESDAILTISAATKDDIVKLLGIPPEKISVVYPGIDHLLFNPGNAGDPGAFGRLRDRYGIGDRYFVYVGDTDWRKNLRRILTAFAGCVECAKLVLIGKRALQDRELHNWITEYGLEDRVVLTGFVPEKELPLFYGSAQALIFPSIYEGFGFPVAEAMACGCPVITSNVSSLPEVAGDAAILVNPESVHEIGAAMKLLLDDAGCRKRLAGAGIRQAARFSWERCAAEVLAILQNISG